jgi:hypothetical protein
MNAETDQGRREKRGDTDEQRRGNHQPSTPGRPAWFFHDDVGHRFPLSNA